MDIINYRQFTTNFANESGMDIGIQYSLTKTDKYLDVNRIIFKSCEFIYTEN